MKNSRSDKFFTEEERAKIKEAIHDVESRTIGEMAVMVVDSSDDYAEADVTGGIFLGSLLSLVITAIYFHSSVWFFIPINFMFFFPSKLIFNKLPFFKTAFIGVRRKEGAVRLRAERAFFEKGLYKTKKNTGVLFFLSLLEKRVWVLADKGIYEKIEQVPLNKFALVVSEGIKNRRACDVLCDAIREAGELLAAHFPIVPGDTDELTNNVMTE